MQGGDVEFLFGKLGTHARIAGATLRLKDAFESDRFGRKVVVEATSRRIAASAMSALLFQLCLLFRVPTPLDESKWRYLGNVGLQKGEVQGPVAYKSLVRWREKGQLDEDELRCQHEATRCWVPLWFVVAAGEKVALEECAPESGDDVSMEDAEQLVADLNSQRSTGGMLQPPRGDGHLADFPWLSEEQAAEPMDIEPGDGGAPQEGARLFVVVDTNVLMSHIDSVTKTLEEYGAAATQASGEGKPVVEVLLLVPWIVLCELDLLKGSNRREQAGSARRALRRLHALTSMRDSFVRLQPAKEHAQAVQREPIPGASPQLRNDDMILQTVLFYRANIVHGLRAAGRRSGAFLLSNDSGLAVRAQANGVRCFTALEFPRGAEQLAQAVPEDGDAGPVTSGGTGQQPGLVPPGSGRHSLDSQPAGVLPGASSGGSLHLQGSGSLPQPASPAQQPPLPHSQPPRAAHLAAAAAPHQQAQAQQLTEQMRQLQMAGQQAAAASLQQQQQAAAAFQQQQQAAAAFQQQQQQEQAAAAFHHHQQQQQQQQAAAAFQQQQQQQQRVQATTAQHPAAVLGALQKAFIERDAELGIMAGALGVPLEQLLSAVAAHVGMPLQQLARERQQALAGGPVSPQLLQAVRLVDRARGDPQLAATLLQAQAQAQHLAELQQRALGSQQEALAQLGPNLQALALLQGQLQAATAGLGSNGGSAGGGGGLMPGMQAQQGGPQRGGAVAALWWARRRLAAAAAAANFLEDRRRGVEELWAPWVMHHRQEERGDRGLETGEDREGLPGDARSTLRAIFKHKTSSTWGLLEKDLVEKELTQLERYLKDSRPAEVNGVTKAVHAVLAVLRQFHHAALKSLGGDPKPGDKPDPATIELFVSLEEARAAAERGIQRCSQLLDRLQPAGRADAALPSHHSLGQQ
ncbi:hypothetical protein CHLNCDRAFT_135567 [Chlorella variabilis]|uniref:PIN domain-containing protein n=1 Tax=Chlorella variabilis TaxID=554065 RepID=E1ZIH0_CHLVA|nr:hypothetical protein CHLNCDRAFT_135567 [Chlorella variabilis]EFN54158.1 hypothetical protein CHLNCDRAFT_135567 [Chlorella variabilis]|eukprot:XP_005846260.1 hypothetical protein CHLNCDRAFT_135567 [Chlorella variabilis]